MIEHHFDPPSATLHIQPKSALEKADFEKLAAAVNPFAQSGDLAGLIIETSAR